MHRGLDRGFDQGRDRWSVLRILLHRHSYTACSAEWFTLHNKDKYCGEVYLELTFWSNVLAFSLSLSLSDFLSLMLWFSLLQEPPPEKKAAAPKASKANKQYGGPGSFIPSGDLPSVLASGQGSHPSRIMSTSGIADHSRQSSVPSSLRASNSLAQIDLYVPPYEKSNGSPAVDRMANDFGEMRVSDVRRRESFPVSVSYMFRCIALTDRTASTRRLHAATFVCHATVNAF